MISNDRNSGSEFNFLIKNDAYRIKNYPDNYFHSVLDVGANIGFFSVYMRMKNPNASIVAVEPCIETCRYLRQNLNMLYIPIEEKALGSGQPLYLEKGQRGKHEILGHIFAENSKYENTYKVETITLKQLNDKYKVRRPYVVKMNCEGGEKHLIDDSTSHTVLKKADFIGLMVHYQNDRNLSYSKHWLKLEDYETFLHNLLGDTHYIERHHNNKRGSSIYSIYKYKEFSYGAEGN